jgi:GT2 family glycosyltransferase
MSYPDAQFTGNSSDRRLGALHISDCKKELPRVTIVILNWNGWEVTSDCLNSLKQISYPNYNIVIVDNGSTDCSIERLSAAFPDVELIKNERNLGFAGGNNVGIRYALKRGAQYILLLNNDTVVSSSFLASMIRVAEQNPKIGILNPKIYYLDPPGRIWYAGGQFSLWKGFAHHIGQRKRDDARYANTREVSFITGCAFLIKAEVIAQIGLLDERFFMVCEDTDWSLRSLKAGFKAVYVADAVVLHRESYTINSKVGKWMRDYHNMRSSALLIRKHAKVYHWPSFCFFLGTRLVYRTLGYIALGQFDRLRAQYRGLWDGMADDHSVEMRAGFRRTVPRSGGVD